MGDLCERAQHHQLKLPHRDPKSPPLFRSPPTATHSGNTVVSFRPNHSTQHIVHPINSGGAPLGRHHRQPPTTPSSGLIVTSIADDSPPQAASHPNGCHHMQSISTASTSPHHRPTNSAAPTDEQSVEVASTATATPHLIRASQSPAAAALHLDSHSTRCTAGNAPSISMRIADYPVTHPSDAQSRKTPSQATTLTWRSDATKQHPSRQHQLMGKRGSPAASGNYNVVKQSVFLYAIASVALAMFCMSSTVVAENEVPSHQMWVRDVCVCVDMSIQFYTYDNCICHALILSNFI